MSVTRGDLLRDSIMELHHELEIVDGWPSPTNRPREAILADLGRLQTEFDNLQPHER